MRVGDLSAKRDFLDVDEAARLLLALAAMPHWPWPVVNVCSGQAYRLGDLLDGLIAASGIEVRVETDPALMRPGDMPILTGSTERLGVCGAGAAGTGVLYVIAAPADGGAGVGRTNDRNSRRSSPNFNIARMGRSATSPQDTQDKSPQT